MNRTSTLIVGDHRDSADILAHGLTQGGIWATAIGVEDSVSKCVRDGALALIILDVYDPETDITSWCCHLRRVFDGPIVVLSYESDERFLLSLYKQGIAEHITKPIGTPLLMAKVTAWMRRVARESNPLQNFQNGDGLFELDALRRVVTTPKGNKVCLSKLEYRLLDILYSNRGQVLHTNLLVDRIWGQVEPGDSRLKHLILRLRRKIEPDPGTPTHIQTVGREGYRFGSVAKRRAHIQ